MVPPREQKVPLREQKVPLWVFPREQKVPLRLLYPFACVACRGVTIEVLSQFVFQ